MGIRGLDADEGIRRLGAYVGRKLGAGSLGLRRPPGQGMNESVGT